MRTLIDRLKDRCVIDDCWEWTGAFDGKGLPSVQILALRENTISVRRIMFLLAVGPLAKGRVVLTTCDNPKCVNPAHLKLTTKASLNRLICSTRRPRAKKPKVSTWHPSVSGAGKTSSKRLPPRSEATLRLAEGLLSVFEDATGIARQSRLDGNCGPTSARGRNES